MSGRITRVNKHIQRVFGEILHEEADLPTDVLVTISKVSTTPNLKSATIWLYISPSSKEEEVLERLKPQMYELQGALNRSLEMRPLPRISLQADHGAQHAQVIEQKLAEIKEDQEE
ncbi:MAG: ribosome-binding factor A [Candidatus Andersenbacteria bacterium]